MKDKKFSMPEHVETIKSMWELHTQQEYKDQPDIKFVSDLNLKPILLFLKREGVAQDTDKVKSIIEAEIGQFQDEGRISFAEYQAVFCKPIFRQALIRIGEEFKKDQEKRMRGNKIQPGFEPNLKQQVQSYKRSQLVEGLKSKPGSDKYEDTRSKLMGLQGIIEKEEPGFIKARENYIEYLKGITSDAKAKQASVKTTVETAISPTSATTYGSVKLSKRNQERFEDLCQFIKVTEAQHQNNNPIAMKSKRKK